jgi:hypothetical protein
VCNVAGHRRSLSSTWGYRQLTRHLTPRLLRHSALGPRCRSSAGGGEGSGADRLGGLPGLGSGQGSGGTPFWGVKNRGFLDPQKGGFRDPQKGGSGILNNVNFGGFHRS